MYRKISCPMLMIHGEDDQIQPCGLGRRGGDHVGGTGLRSGGRSQSIGRFPARCNALINDFLDRKLGIPAAARRKHKPAEREDVRP